jgi:hypothetical protein
MKVITPGGARLFLAPVGDFVEGECEVPDDIGLSLLEQGWTTPKPAKAATKSKED